MIDEGEIQRAAAALSAGDLVVFPTETVYGIGCDALNPEALARLCAVKRRPAEKGIAVILGNAAMLEQITTSTAGDVAKLAAAFWPGPLTLLVPARPDLPTPIVREGLTGCRVSSDDIARRLSAALGRPLASPSANPADLESAHDAATARRYFGDDVCVYLDAGRREGKPSTILDPGPPYRILRPGPIDGPAIHAVLAGS
ncbi:MAG: L-threonylcarbamoyladenylate synthase [Candidatus Binatia bacterium]|nr:L-threonylcarbamoyladenylate synthase [Candidatus Binatia bacterium]